MSADGRYVLFWSAARNLVDDDTNEQVDLFIHDRHQGTTARVNPNRAGWQGDYGIIGGYAINADGRFVAFTSSAADLVDGDANRVDDVFVRDMMTGAITRVSVSGSGTEANDGSGEPAISADGRFVAFQSAATNLVPDDANGVSDVFVHDRARGSTMRASINSFGIEARLPEERLFLDVPPRISGDGRYVTFSSGAAHWVDGDRRAREDIFLSDWLTGDLYVLSSMDDEALEGLADCLFPVISADGRHVAFRCYHDIGAARPGSDILVHDRATGTTARVVALADEFNSVTSISADGRFIAFLSSAPDFAPNDTNRDDDIFVLDRNTGQVDRVSVDSTGIGADTGSAGGSLSADGRLVAFSSRASKLVPRDTNDLSDIFVHDRTTGRTTRVNVDSTGNQATEYERRGEELSPAAWWSLLALLFTAAGATLVWRVRSRAG